MNSQQKKQTAWKANVNDRYEIFLSLRKDADPGIAEVEDAKKRLAAVRYYCFRV